MNKSIVAVVVTYNRKSLLMECLQAILEQTYPVSKILLIDNASTDGTEETLSENGYLVNPKINYIKMKVNTGGSGGFYEGMKRTMQESCNWVWVMDDDTIPTKTCLENLLDAEEIVRKKPSDACPDSAVNPSFFASAIYGPDNEFMNLPVISKKPSANGYAYWYQFLKDGLVSIQSATFVSILVNKNAILRCGLPCKDYFIWGDDTEYTTRLTKYYGDAYMVGNSVAIHKRIGAKELSIFNEENPQRLKMFHYFFRNASINRQYYENKNNEIVYLCTLFLKYIKNITNSMNRKRYQIMIKGTIEGITQYKKFRKYIDSQISQVEK